MPGSLAPADVDRLRLPCRARRTLEGRTPHIPLSDPDSRDSRRSAIPDPVRDPRSRGDLLPEVLLDDPVRLPLIGLACRARQIDCLAAAGCVAGIGAVSPSRDCHVRINSCRRATSPAYSGRSIRFFVSCGSSLQVEQLAGVDRGVDDQLPALVPHRPHRALYGRNGVARALFLAGPERTARLCPRLRRGSPPASRRPSGTGRTGR